MSFHCLLCPRHPADPNHGNHVCPSPTSRPSSQLLQYHDTTADRLHLITAPAFSKELKYYFVSITDKHSWDDWVPQDRLRKLTPENRELANNIRHEMLQAQRAARAAPPPVKKRAQGSTRGSEERQTSVSAAPRGQKRMRDQDLEKVCLVFRPLPHPQACSLPRYPESTHIQPLLTLHDRRRRSNRNALYAFTCRTA